MVQLFTDRAELLDKGETTAEHRQCRQEEAGELNKDKENLHPKTGGLFRGLFRTEAPPARPIIDLEDGVLRCPQCSWEIEDESEGCVQCGFRESWSSDGSADEETDSEDNSEMADDVIEDAFGDSDVDEDFDWNDFYDGVPFTLGDHPLHHLAGPGPFFGRFRSDPYDSASRQTPSSERDDSEGDAYSDDDMDSFIDDDEHDDGENDEEIGNGEEGDEGENRHNEGRDYDSQSDRSTVNEDHGHDVRVGQSMPFISGASISERSHDSENEESGSESTAFEFDRSERNDPDEDDSEEDDPEEAEEDDIDGDDIDGGNSDNDISVDDYDSEGSDTVRTRPYVYPSIGNASGGRDLAHPACLRSINRRSRPCRDYRCGQRVQSAGLDAYNAIDISDDSDEEPVRPTRRAWRR